DLERPCLYACWRTSERACPPVAPPDPPPPPAPPPARGRRPPATMRSREDLPAPLGPVTRSASPVPTLKLSPRKTSRPPLTQARFDPRSRITGRPPTNGPGCSGSNGISRRQHPH